VNSKKVIVGVVDGIAAGALLAILFAPKKGSEIRKKIHKLGGEFEIWLKKNSMNYLNDIQKINF